MDIEREACKRELRAIWNKYGISVLSRSLADLLKIDARLVEESGRFPTEVDEKDLTADRLYAFATFMK